MTSFTGILSCGEHEAAVGDGGTPDFFADLHLDQIITEVTAGHGGEQLSRLFAEPARDVATVNFRHAVFRDLARAEYREPIDRFVAGMQTVQERRDRSEHLYHPLQQQGWLVHAVEAYCDTVTALRDDLMRAEPTARGLREFASHLDRYVTGPDFQRLADDNAEVQSELHRIRYTVHIQELRVHVAKFDGQIDYSPEVAATFERFATEATKDYHLPLADYPDMNHVEEHILELVAKLYPEPFRTLESFCSRNREFVSPTISRFTAEIQFYLSYLDFMERLVETGLTFCYPDVTSQPGVVDADDAFDLALAVKATTESTPLVRNSFRLSGPERIFVVTGPNQGGKTTFARTIGQCAHFAALGCPIPARRGAFTLPDRIYTHFERQETLATLHGKLDDELLRIHDILSRMSATSLLVMNESFASTTLNDALLIGTEVLHRIIALGATAIYVSFVDELASLDPACVSMVGEVAPDDPSRRTFQFTRRPADGLAYAAALAIKYRLDRETLRQRIAGRVGR